MFSHRYSKGLFFCIVALIVVFNPTPAPSNDTPIDQIVSCVYPMSGQYGLLPRLLFYASLIFASTMRRSGWFTSIVLGLAMSYSTTAFVHLIVIYAAHGWNPPILDLDVLGIFLLGAVGMSMYPALAASQRSRYTSAGLEIVVGLWWFIMFLISSLATLLLNNLKDLRQNSNSEVACYLPDNTLLTSLAQLNGTRDLECIYDCFLTRKSVMKTQDAVTVMWGSPMSDNVGNWGLTIGATFSSLMLVLGSDIQTYPRTLKWLRTRLLRPVYSVENQDKRAVMTPIVYICLISMAPWIIMIEYSLRSIPVEEMSFAVGQWAPWVAAAFAIIGGGIYRLLQDTKDGEEGLDLVVNPQTDYVMAGALSEPGGNIPRDDLLALDKREDIAASNQSAHLLDEIDLGTCRVTPEPER